MPRPSPSMLAAALVIAVAATPLQSQPTTASRTTAITTDRTTLATPPAGTVRRLPTELARPRSNLVTGAATAATPEVTAAGAGTTTPQGTPQGVVSKPISRARLQQTLGSAQRLRIVRPSGVTDVSPSATVVNVAPGEFLFRKLSDTARRVATPIRVRPSGIPHVTPDEPSHPTPAPSEPPVVTAAPPGSPGPAATPTPAPATPSSPDATFAMPYRWMTVDSAGAEHVLVPYFVLLDGGLSYDVESRMYTGRALIGVEDTLNQSPDAVPLARPLNLLLSMTKGGGISPAQIAIAHTSFAYDSVLIRSPDSNLVRISTRADQSGIFVPIPVLGMTIAMTPQLGTLQGFGLGTTDISVTLPRGIGSNQSALVSFSATGSPVRPDKVRVSGAEGATVHRRSGLPGTNTIHAFIDGVEVGHTEVVSAPPISFLVATLLGILLGGVARFVGGKRRKRVRSLPWDIVKGAPFGLLASIGGAVGLDLVQLKLGEPGALPAIMVTAAIGAWFGVKILDRGGAPAPAAAHAPV